MSAAAMHALPKGYNLDAYEIVRVLGIGGFGITYLAYDHRSDGPVALKEYFPSEFAARVRGHRVTAASDESRELFTWGLDRFIDEAQAIHRFRHRNVVRAHRCFRALGTAYIVMDYVEGDSLAVLLETRGPLPVAEWRRWMERLLVGLDHVHSHGYLHRDIKPANIVIRATDNEPVLIDFGAARVAASERTLTQVLTPEYAPIEQHGSEGKQGPPTDIYSLAAVSYRALTGEPPPTSPDRVLDDWYKPLTEHIRGADRVWLAAIDQGLALRPKDRPQTVAAWRTALNKATHDNQRTPLVNTPELKSGRSADDVNVRPGDRQSSLRRWPSVAVTTCFVLLLLAAILFPKEEERMPPLRADVTSSVPALDRPVQPGMDPAQSSRSNAVSEDAPIAPVFDRVAQQEEAGGPPPIPLDEPPPTAAETLDTLLELAEQNVVPQRQERPDEEIAAGAAEQPTVENEDQQPLSVYPGFAAGEYELRINSEYFTRGSHQDDVLRIQGTPDQINRYDALGHEVWRYGRSRVDVSTRSQQVLVWSNDGGNLRVRLEPGPNVTGAEYFTRGSHQDDVLRIQGTPDQINRYDALGHEVWRYGRSSVNVSTRSQQVLVWSNDGGNLRVRLEPGSNATGAEYFTRGSHQDDVLRIQGTPDQINRYDALGHEVWRYGRSSVNVSTRSQQVLVWSNDGGNLRVRLEPGSNATGAEYFTRGSHQDDVLRIQGTPDQINRYDALGHEVWRYGRSSVNVSTRSQQVLEWSNAGGNLRVRLAQGSGATRAPPERLPLSADVTAGNIISQVQPQYPELARQARISDTVLFEAVIGRDGSIQNLRVVRGHPLLAPAAEEAVRQWRYRPTMMNGEPVEVVTTISVTFSLN